MRNRVRRPWYSDKIEKGNKNLFKDKRRRMIENYNYWKYGNVNATKLWEDKQKLGRPKNCS